MFRKSFSIILICLLFVGTFGGCSSQKQSDTDTLYVNDNTDHVVKDNSMTEDTSDLSAEDDPSSVETESTYEEMVEAQLSEFVDLSAYPEPSLFEGNKYVEYTYKSQSLKYDLSYQIDLKDGSAFSLPTTVSEVESQGWKLTSGIDSSTQQVKAHIGHSLTMTNSEGSEISIKAFNATDDTVYLKDCTVKNFSCTQYKYFGDPESLDTAVSGFTVLNGITENDTFKDVVARLGAPTHIYCSVHTDDDGAFDYTKLSAVYFDKENMGNIMFSFSGDGETMISLDVDVINS